VIGCTLDPPASPRATSCGTFSAARVLFTPKLCFLVSAAVGFPVSIYHLSVADDGTPGPLYQVMRWDESPGPGHDFWDWYLWNRPQFFASPELAAVAFVQEWQAWSSRIAA
jgi:hypothetical protein